MTRFAEDPETGATGLRVNFVRLVRLGKSLAAPGPEAFGIESEPAEVAAARPYAEPTASEEPAVEEAEASEDEEWEEEDIEEGC